MKRLTLAQYLRYRKQSLLPLIYLTPFNNNCEINSTVNYTEGFSGLPTCNMSK